MNEKKFGSRHERDRTLIKKSLILASYLLILLLTYIGTVLNPYMPGRWQAGCCGREFWWSAVGAAVVLVGSAIALFLRQTLALILATLMSIYVLLYSLYLAVDRWNDHAPLDEAYGLWQALLPVYRPLSVLLSIFVITMSLKQLARRFSGGLRNESSRSTSTQVDN